MYSNSAICILTVPEIEVRVRSPHGLALRHRDSVVRRHKPIPTAKRSLQRGSSYPGVSSSASGAPPRIERPPKLGLEITGTQLRGCDHYADHHGGPSWPCYLTPLTIRFGVEAGKGRL